ncbi:ABC-type sugar transport system, periplasmic component [Rhizobium leguminosarum bv. trifolii WSM2012]|nr:ABC-type sugar transport system, periplasmic component [Rhizobium leguminosarum bv. trifolii WSM2012]EJC76918.1 ABC-type sugar transport system, periplasmic component [Rhizobium leguminosarum bv. trifolii WSM2012]
MLKLKLSLAAAAASIIVATSGVAHAADWKLAFVQGTTADEFYVSMKCGVEAAAKKLGVPVTVTGPTKFDVTIQRPIVDSVLAASPSALLIAPNDRTAMRAPLMAAANNGTKIVLVDTTVDKPDFAVSEISSDNVGGGAAAFEAIKAANPKGGKVLVINTAPGISTTDQRVEGFEKAAKADPNFKYLGVQFGKNDPTVTAQVTSAALQKDPDLVGIFAINLLTSEGVATGLKQAGLTGKVTVVGFDAGPAQVKSLKEGTVQALVAQQPYQIGYQGVEQAVAALKGEPTEKKIGTKFTILTKDNVDQNKDAVYMSDCSK